MEATSPKRRRLSPPPSGEGFPDQLHDSMVEEILLRLPLSSVFRSRCVSKLFLSLTTSPYFIQRWELHHASFRQDPPLVLLLQNSDCCNERDFFLCSGVPLPGVKLSGFSLDFLPGFRLNGNDPITVVGSCEDLLLCCNRERFQSDYFVVNPITRQWLALPPTLRLHKSVLAGFVCLPGSVAEARKGGELRFRVVRIPVFRESETECNAEIFSSEDGQWNEYTMTLPEGLKIYRLSQRGVACNGILYWQFNFSGVKVMGLDPFNQDKDGIRVIQNAPHRFDLQPETYVLGSCQGKLRMYRDRYVKGLGMKVWELENVEWRLVQEVPLPEIVAANFSIVDTWNGLSWSLRALAFHPSDGDIIYFELNFRNGTNKVICCNLKMMSMEIVRGYDSKKSIVSCDDAFVFPLPWWPTPVPALSKLCK